MFLRLDVSVASCNSKNQLLRIAQQLLNYITGAWWGIWWGEAQLCKSSSYFRWWAWKQHWLQRANRNKAFGTIWASLQNNLKRSGSYSVSVHILQLRFWLNIFTWYNCSFLPNWRMGNYLFCHCLFMVRLLWPIVMSQRNTHHLISFSSISMTREMWVW